MQRRPSREKSDGTVPTTGKKRPDRNGPDTGLDKASLEHVRDTMDEYDLLSRGLAQ